MDENNRDRSSQSASLRYDDSPERFREGHPDKHFTGASGVLFEQAMAQTRMAICLCDPNQPDLPIVFANRAFRELTGYDEEEIVGRNCRFLQGPRTKKEPVDRMREAIANEDVVVVELLNYRKDGSTFWNALHLGPIYDDNDKLIYFFGSQWDVSDVRAAREEERHAREMARELSHRMKNMFAVISGIVNVTGRVRGVQEEAAEINARIQALGRAYETTLDEASSGSIEIGPAIHAILEPYKQDARILMKGSDLKVPFSIISMVGLILHELAANASKHGAWSGDVSGQVLVDWYASDKGDLLVEWKETGGPQLDGPPQELGAGSSILDRLLRTSSGTINREWNPSGLHSLITIPLQDG
ncbi:PAS domain-containing protein [Parerythrobacter jejuensis]|uniref:histidine kinase n=1 Tax=Parerythrobacter jejuensis TaxID=795812 RepID=A0A845AL24_9SPHN|nr:PAS domain-containing protein [Parerythrobacter jejuensis]MXP30314.1 PAS domain-containing protein [Parerythrobacter jejuensis]MXP33074.1 PAS domain-containing protein [Parerythrobacter jejuensis]